MWSRVLLRIGDNRLPKRVMSGGLENAAKRGPGGKEKQWANCVAQDRWVLGITEDWSAAGCAITEATMHTRGLLWSGALLLVDDRRLPKRVMSEELNNTEKCGPGGKEK